MEEAESRRRISRLLEEMIVLEGISLAGDAAVRDSGRQWPEERGGNIIERFETPSRGPGGGRVQGGGTEEIGGWSRREVEREGIDKV